MRQLVPLFIVFMIIGFAFASNMWVSFENSYATDGNINVNVYVDDDSDGNYLDSNVTDINFIVYRDENSTGTYTLDHNEIVQTSSGLVTMSTSVDNLGTGDYNLLFIDLNNNQNKMIDFYIPRFKDLGIEWNSNPPFNYPLSNGDINFRFIAYDENRNPVAIDQNFEFSVYNGNGTKLGDYNAVADSDNNIYTDYIDFDESSVISTGKYYVALGDYKTFTFDIQSFKLLVSIQDLSGNTRTEFAPDENIAIEVSALSNGSVLSNVSGVRVYVSNSSGALTALSASDTGFQKIYTSKSDVGEYTVKVEVDDSSSNTQTKTSSFVVKSTRFNFFYIKNSLLNKERVPGTYGSDQNVFFAYKVVDASTGANTLTNDLNCQNAISEFGYSKIGGLKFNALNQTSSASLAQDSNYYASYDSAKDYCKVQFVSPVSEGKYNYSMKLNSNYADVQRNLLLNVQNYLVFLKTIDAESDNFSNANKDKFYAGDTIGFVPVVKSLNGGSEDINFVSVRDLYFDGNSDANIASFISTTYMDGNNMFSLADYETGGFHPVSATLIDSDGNSYSAFGGFKMKVYNITAQLAVDGNSSKTITEFFGPPMFSTDNNVGFVFSVKNSANSAVAYADINVISIKNLVEFEDLDLSSYNVHAITNSSGSANLNLGSTLSSGTYLAKIQVTGDSIDTQHVFFMVKNYMAFVMPIDYPDNNSSENQLVGKDENYYGLLQVFNMFGGGEQIALESIDTSSLKLYREGDGEEFKAEPYSGTLIDAGISITNERDSRDQNLLILTPASGTWDPGFYHFFVDITARQGNETAEGFFQVQNFYFESLTSLEDNEEMGPPRSYVSPDSNMTLYIKSDENISNLSASLREMESWDTVSGADDLNIYFDSGEGIRVNGTDLNDINFTSAYETIYVEIPTIELKEYSLVLEATSFDLETAESDEFVEGRLWSIVKPLSSYQIRSASYQRNDSTNLLDTNVLDNHEDSDSLKSYCNTYNADTNAIDGTTENIDAIILGYDHYNSFTYDNPFRTAVLVNLEQGIILDLDRDCNVNDDFSPPAGIYPAANKTDGNYVAIPIDLNSEQGESIGRPIITGIHKSGVYFITTSDMNQSESADSFNNWYGEYSLDGNIALPLIIQDLSSNAISEATVEISRVSLVDPLNPRPQVLTAVTDYNVYSDTTDINGLAMPKIDVSKTGSYQVEIKVSKSGNTQNLMPWEGPMFGVKRYNTTSSVVREHKNPTNVSGIETGDLNLGIVVRLDTAMSTIDPTLNLGGSYSSFIGVLSDSEDLDKDSNTDETWYVFYDVSQGKYLIDDDYNLTESPEGYGMHKSEFGSWPICLADYNSDYDGGRNDCRSYEGEVDLDTGLTFAQVDTNINLIANSTFADANSEDTSIPNYWTLGINTNSGDENVRLSTSEGNGDNYSVFMNSSEDGAGMPTNTVYAQQTISSGVVADRNYTLSFDAKCSGDGNVLSWFLYDNSNYVFDKVDNNWADDVYPVNASDHSVQFYTGDWTNYSVDFNTYDATFNPGNLTVKILTGFGGESFSYDYNCHIDNLKIEDIRNDVNTISIYNVTRWRPVPSAWSSIFTSGGGTAWERWIDLNRSPDTNILLEVAVEDVDSTSLSIGSGTVSADVIRQSCSNTNNPEFNKIMSVEGLETYSGSGKFVLDLGPYTSSAFSTGFDDNGCMKLELFVDTNMYVTDDSKYYSGTSFEQLYLYQE